MPSSYAAFDVKIDNQDGTETLVPEASLVVRDITDADPATGVGAIALADIAADAQGHVEAGVLAIDVGRTVRFTWFRDLDGRCGSATTITTA